MERLDGKQVGHRRGCAVEATVERGERSMEGVVAVQQLLCEDRRVCRQTLHAREISRTQWNSE